MMSRSKVILVMMFVLALGAGVVMGVLAVKGPSLTAHGSPHGKGGGPRGPFEGIVLSEQQKQQIRTIWEEFSRGGRDGGREGDRWGKLRKERDEAIEALMTTPEQKAALARIKQNYDTGLEEMRSEQRKSWEAAVEKTRAILNDEQRAKYDENGKKRAEHDRERGPHNGPPRGGPPEFGGPRGGPPEFGGGPRGPRRSSTRGGASTRPSVEAASASPSTQPAAR